VIQKRFLFTCLSVAISIIALSYNNCGKSGQLEGKISNENLNSTAPDPITIQLSMPEGTNLVCATRTTKLVATVSGPIESVEFRRGDTNALVSTDTVAPFEADWNLSCANGTGVIPLKAIGKANDGRTVESTVQLTITPPPPPPAITIQLAVPEGLTIMCATRTTKLVATVSGPIVSVEFRRADTNALIVSDTASPFEADWNLSCTNGTGVIPLKAIGKASDGRTVESTVQLTITPEPAPAAISIQLSIPEGTNLVCSTRTTKLVATVSGPIVSVEFRRSDTNVLIVNDTVSPFEADWNLSCTNGTGVIPLKAIGKASDGRTVESIVQLTITAPPAITIQLVAASGTNYVCANTTTKLVATVSGPIVSVEFWRADTNVLVATDTTSPFETDWSLACANGTGTIPIKAIGKASDGRTVETILQLTITAPPPTITIQLSIPEGTTVICGFRTTKLVATVSGPIVSVEFWRVDSNYLMSTDNSSPFEMDWSLQCSNGTGVIPLKAIGKASDGRTVESTIQVTVVPTPPAAAAGEIISVQTAKPVLIDGVLNEFDWAVANAITFSNASRSNNTTQVKSMWDSQYLYVGFSVQDSLLEAQNTQVFMDDGAEVYIDTLYDRTTALNANDYTIFLNINDVADGPLVSSIARKTAVVPGGYNIEFRIPWTSINTTGTKNKVMGILFCNNDRDNGVSTQYDWMGLINTGSYSRPNLWGKITLWGP
jgi:hypothetical protein